MVPLNEEQTARYWSRTGYIAEDETLVTLLFTLVVVTNPNDVVGEVWARLRGVDEEGIKYDLDDDVRHISIISAQASPNAKYVALIIKRQRHAPHNWVLEQWDNDSLGGYPQTYLEFSVDPMDNEFFTIEDIANNEDRRWVVNRTDSRLSLGWACEYRSPLRNRHFVLGGGDQADLIPTFQKFPDVTHSISTNTKTISVEPKTKKEINWPVSRHHDPDVIVNCHSWWASLN